MGLFEWIFNNLYIVAVIGFALFSFLGKAAKSSDPNKKRQNNGMPTFGGSGDSDQSDRSPAQTSPKKTASTEAAGETRYDEPYENQYDEPYENQYDEGRYDQPYSGPQASSRPSDEVGSRNFSGEMERSLDQQKKEFERQQRLIQERLNRFSSSNKPVVADSSWDQVESSESGNSQLRPEDIRTGVLWAEVLGAPRSKQPFGSRGKL
ncbi:hypothetical protein QP794_16620 [Paenibacillus sp. UMB7766-LJ446]|uniref:hypothetical protein n=1 Tax=Paenibacillus TaxID=44249 RepID=UPI000BA02D57|nr:MULTISPECIES: hypothetical protein [Paenibacillus]MDK8191714.1 hypothetical protein [Paenibacillus sp. UMB7766-LJ446]MDN8588285.1 hypothetical protein [Paenibacillus sp. 11B]OZQ71480.1 hypothetical protein CA599_09945 [Paenibacillus taichungensis]HBU85436.1 hypothetical protein [Paenibacillus sp.]